MQSTNTPTVRDHAPELDSMRAQVLAGLETNPKYLPPLFLYDEEGMRLFNQITETPEYYPTRTEIGILESNADAFRELLGHDAVVIAPGAGAGIKTRLLLESLDHPRGYVPIDISREHLAESAAEINAAFPKLKVVPVCADFHEPLDLPLAEFGDAPRVVYFPGSTIGNMLPDDAVALLKTFRSMSNASGGVFIGVDLVKDVDVLEPAYNDAGGVSATFALNYLKRLNAELDADFDLEQWTYDAWFDPIESRIIMALISEIAQEVTLDDATVTFAARERVRTEYSYKFTLDSFAALAARAGLAVRHVWTDPKQWFSLQYLVPA
jgi:dimethylhistidine N-methyltransferase